MALSFGTSGVREITGKFDLRRIVEIGYNFSKGRKRVGVAWDCRSSSELYAHALISGIEAGGTDVEVLGFVPSPVAEFMIRHRKLDGVAIITASHNPKEWNGIKIVDKNGVIIPQERANAMLEEKVVVPSAWNSIGKDIVVKGVMETYLSEIRKHADIQLIKKAKLKVAVDCSNCTAVNVLPLFREIAELFVFNEKVDGSFPGRPSEPKEANIQELINFVKEGNADIGIAWDGDGDRISLAAPSGFVSGDVVFALAAERKLRHKKGIVVSTVGTSNVVDEVVKAAGGSVVKTKVGVPYIVEKLIEVGGIMAGEEVGGTVWPEFSYAKDGFLTGLKMLEIEAEEGIENALRRMPKYWLIKEKVECTEKKKAMEAIYAKYPQANMVDGVRVDMEDGSWFLIRPSGTENFIRVFAESKDKAKAEKIARELVEFVKQNA
ncbi:MAG: hypothetical protein QW035_02025 [Candidatus Anstonellales archaeon]